MPKNTRVFAHDSDPAIDSHLFRISRDDAASRLANGYVRYLSPTAVQLLPPPGWTPESFCVPGLFESAWRIKPSDNYLVWQMRPTLSDTPTTSEE